MNGKLVPISYQKLIRIFELDGFQVKRQRGDQNKGDGSILTGEKAKIVESFKK